MKKQKVFTRLNAASQQFRQRRNYLTGFTPLEINRTKRVYKVNKSLMGFTLIEILVVTAIVGILASVVTVVALKVREKTRITAGLQFSSTIHNALGAYLVGEWKFEDNLSDSSGNLLGGNWIGPGGPVYFDNDASPQLGKSIRFTDGNNYIEVLDPGVNSILDIEDKITIEAWVRINDFGPTADYIAWKSLSYYLLINTLGEPRFELRDGGVSIVHNPSIEVFKLGKWYHYVATWDGSKMRIFVDGREIGDPESFSGSIDTADRSFNIGGGVYDGFLDEVRIYDESLTSAQIKKLYAEGAEKHGLLVEK